MPTENNAREPSAAAVPLLPAEALLRGATPKTLEVQRVALAQAEAEVLVAASMARALYRVARISARAGVAR